MTFRETKGYRRDLGDDIFERVDEQRDIIGFAIFNFSKRDRKAIDVPLNRVSHEDTVAEFRNRKKQPFLSLKKRHFPYI